MIDFADKKLIIIVIIAFSMDTQIILRDVYELGVQSDAIIRRSFWR
jgi:hypothetical protein